MKAKFDLLSALVLAELLSTLNPQSSTASTWYVWQNSPTDGPGSAWNNAFHVVQEAVNAATNGDTVVVTNGTYRTGATVGPDGVTNVVLVTNTITLESVNGPGATVIVGGGLTNTSSIYSAPDATARCVYLAANATLSGFNLTNGNSGFAAGGGVFCAVSNAIITNCIFVGNNSSYGGGDAGGTLYDCIFTNNGAAGPGGGAAGATLYNCTLVANVSPPSIFFENFSFDGSGGGAASCTLSNCTVSGNSAEFCNWGGESAFGGGVNNCTVINSVISNNICNGLYSSGGGGAYGCTLVNSILNNNVCTGDGINLGGGAGNCTLSNSVLSGNYCEGAGLESGGFGGGASGSTLNNCSVIGNTAVGNGGGVQGCTLNNCRVSGNTATAAYGPFVSTSGGGANISTLNNCLVSSNSADFGGGCSDSTLINCTIVANTAATDGGGVADDPGYEYTLTNCIVFDNNAPSDPNYDTNGALGYCCAEPLAPGPGNISSDPQFVNAAAGDYHLLGTSPCINAGDNSVVASATDLGGNPRIVFGTVDLGAYEYQDPLLAPIITNTIASTTVSSGGSVTLTAGVLGTPPFTYQWFDTGVPIVGATNATLVITNFSLANAGSYTVTVGNQAGSVTSLPVTLASVDIKMFAGVIVDGPLGSNYAIQVSSNLSSGNWMTLTNVALPSQPYIYIDYSSPTNRQEFYRAIPVQ